MKRRTVLQATGAIVATVAAGVSLHRAEDFRSLIGQGGGYWVLDGDRFVLKQFEDLRPGMLIIETLNTGESETSTQKLDWVLTKPRENDKGVLFFYVELLQVQKEDPTGIIPDRKGDFVQVSVLMFDKEARRESGQIVTRANPALFNSIRKMAWEDNIRILSMIDDSEFFLAV